MWHRLALWMGLPVSELKRRMPAREFRGWCAYYLLEPWHPDYGTAIGAQATCAALGVKHLKPADLLPQMNLAPQVQSQADIIATFRRAAMAAGVVANGHHHRQAERDPGA